MKKEKKADVGMHGDYYIDSYPFPFKSKQETRHPSSLIADGRTSIHPAYTLPLPTYLFALSQEEQRSCERTLLLTLPMSWS